MKRILFLCISIKFTYALLMPAPFITEPESLQRLGYSFTEEYFEKRLIGETYEVDKRV